MFLKYDLVDFVNNQTFKGVCNLNNVLEIIRAEWPNQDNQTIRIVYSTCNTPLFSSNKEYVNHVYLKLIELLTNRCKVVIKNIGTMEIL